MSNEIIASPRRYDLDWLRVLAILAVFVFHSGRFFDQMDWHVKSATLYPGAQAWTLFLIGWLMPLVFVVSGASLFYAVGKGSVAGFLRDKILRLLVPFVVGVFTHVALAVYLERITHNQFSGSIFSFYPHYFDGMYGFGGNFAWMGLHLWYLLVLFVFTLVFLPLFYLLKGWARGLLSKLVDFLSTPGVLLVLTLPVALLSAVLDPRSGLGQRNFGGWPVPVYGLYLFYGFIVFSQVRLQAQIRERRMLYLTGALVGSAVLFWQFSFVLPPNGTRPQLYFGLLFIVSSWCWILAFIGFAVHHLTNNGPFLKRANEAVLPFYIMHQTALLFFGYLILPWQIPDPVKWLLIALSSFALVLGLYEFAVRRSNILRILFGMRTLPNVKNR
jgi:peptidoglycan/LPS O-acetylase OafA/YrhL